MYWRGTASQPILPFLSITETEPSPECKRALRVLTWQCDHGFRTGHSVRVYFNFGSQLAVHGCNAGAVYSIAKYE